jgi:hypothetical protein
MQFRAVNRLSRVGLDQANSQGNDPVVARQNRIARQPVRSVRLIVPVMACALLAGCGSASSPSRSLPTLSMLKAMAAHYPSCHSLGIAAPIKPPPPGTAPTVTAVPRRFVRLGELYRVEEAGPAACAAPQYVAAVNTQPPLEVIINPTLSKRDMQQLADAEVAFLRATGLFVSISNTAIPSTASAASS